MNYLLWPLLGVAEWGEFCDNTVPYKLDSRGSFSV